MSSLAPDPIQNRPDEIRTLFSTIAGRYDLLNRVLSLGMDAGWRDEAADRALEHGPREILDVATGTGDLALAMKAKRSAAEVIGVDFAEPMLRLGREKAAARGLDVRFEFGDGLALPFADRRFDAVTIAYGLRNFSDYPAGLREFHRVLRPGGRLVILEFPPPPRGLFGRAFRFYFRSVLPRIGGLVSGSLGAYRHLPVSVLAFPSPAALGALMVEAGFEAVGYRLQTFGISAIHVGEKPL